MSISQTAVLTVDGKELASVPGTVNFKPGMTTATPRSGPRGYVGSGKKPNLSELSCDIVPTDEFNIEDLAGGKELTVRIDDRDSSKNSWIIPAMVLTEDAQFSDGDDSKWSVTLQGAKAERV